MLLPLVRNTDYTPGSPVRSADLDDIQDCIRGKKHGPVTRWSLPKGAFFDPGANWEQSTGLGSPFLFANAAGYVDIPIDSEEGDVITGFSYRAKGDGAADCTTTLFVCSENMGTLTTIGSVTDVNQPGAGFSEVILAGPFVPHLMAAGEFLMLKAVATAINYRIGRHGTTYYRP